MNHLRVNYLLLLPFVVAMSGALEREPNPDAWPSLMACAAFASPADRLDCYDKVLPPKFGADEPGDGKPGAVTQGESENSQGAEVAEAALPAFADKRERPKTLTSKVARVLVTGWNKRRSLVLENGQRWEIRQGRQLSVEPGDTVELREGAISSVNVYVNGRYLGKGKLR